MMCPTRRLYPLWIIAFFTIMYLGRSVFESTWMYMGLGSAFMLAFHLKNSKRDNNSNACCIASVYWVALILYQLHQFEEHGIDIMGHAYAFEGFANHFLSTHALFLGCSSSNGCPLNPENIFYINMLFVWFPLLIATHIAERKPFVAACYVGILPANAIAHIVVGFLYGGYNPGLLTAVLLFLPFGFWYYRKALCSKYITKGQALASFLYGALMHPFMMLMLIPTYIQGTHAPYLYPVALILYVLFPLMVSCAKGGCRSMSCDTKYSSSSCSTSKMSCNVSCDEPAACCCCGASDCSCKFLKAGCCSEGCLCCSKSQGCDCTNTNCHCPMKMKQVEEKLEKPKAAAKPKAKAVVKAAPKATPKAPAPKKAAPKKTTPKKPKE